VYQKGEKYYADWRDASGTRKRKAFPTALGAQRYETAQRKLRPLSGGESVTNSQPSSYVHARATKATAGGPLQKPSLQRRAMNPSKPSRSRTSAKLKTATATVRARRGA